MKEEYDFSAAHRAKFYREGAKLHLPVYLDDEVLEYLRERAAEKHVGLSDLVNDLLRRDIALAEVLKP